MRIPEYLIKGEPMPLREVFPQKETGPKGKGQKTGRVGYYRGAIVPDIISTS